MKSSILIFFLWGLLLTFGNERCDATVLSTDFSDPSLSAGIYADGSSISTGTLNCLVRRKDSNFTVQVVQSGYTSSKAVQFIDNAATATTAGLYSDISSFASGGYLSGGYTFIPLEVSSGTRSFFYFTIDSVANISSSVTAVDIYVDSSLGVNYFSGNAGHSTNIVLSVGTQYTITWWADFTSSTQDTYGFSIYDASSTCLYTSGTLNTRAANITPTYMLFAAGLENSTSNADAFVEIESISVGNAIPELSPAYLLFAGMLLATFHFQFKRKFARKMCA